MNENVVDVEPVERDVELCVCHDGTTLEILKDVHRLYEEKMALIGRVGGSKKLQLQVSALRAWVSDLAGQNALLVQTVEQLEAEATTKLILERKRHSEVVFELRAEVSALRRRLARKDSDLRGLVEVLRRLREFDYCTLDGIHFFEVTESDIFGSIEWWSKKGCGKTCELKQTNDTLRKENMAKDREIRQLNKDVQQYEQTILNLRKEITTSSNTPAAAADVRPRRRDAEVMAGMCCTGTECGDWEPVKDYSEMLQNETLQFQERIQKMEANLKSSGESVRALRKVNVSLTDEMQAMRRLCAALVGENRAAAVRAQFKDDIIREMRRQLKQSKAKVQARCKCSDKCTETTVAPDVSNVTSVFRGSVKSTFKERPTSSPIVIKDGSAENLTTNKKKRRAINELSKESTSRCNCPPCSCPGPSTGQTCDLQTSSTQTGHASKTRSNQTNQDSSCSESGEDSPRTQSSQDSSGHPSPLKTCLKTCLQKDKRRKRRRKTVTIDIPERSDKCQECAEEMLRDQGQKSEIAGKSSDCKEPVNPTVNDQEKKIDNSGFEARCSKERTRQLKKTTSTGSSLCQTIKKVMDLASSAMTKDSGGASSLDSATGSCDADARSLNYHNKLMSTQLILQNKEETIRVQAESLAVAEQRILALTERGAELRRELDAKSKELHAVHQALKCYRVEKVDAGVSARAEQEIQKQSDVIRTLQSNLSVIEELYRECFYETAKQEDLIDKLRTSYLDVRERQKHTAIDTHNHSLDKYQDIALEVDNLKMEITNFLSSSTPTNNDSGVWEECVTSPRGAGAGAGAGPHDELRDITEMLLALREILTDPSSCECGLKERVKDLQYENEQLLKQITEFCGRKCELEELVEVKDNLIKKHSDEIERKDKQLGTMKKQIAALMEKSKDEAAKCHQLTTQLQQTQVLLRDKSSELLVSQRECEQLQETVSALHDKCNNIDTLCAENCKFRSEVSYMTTRATDSERRVQDLYDKLRLQAQASYREKEELQRELQQAHTRGAALCADARRALRDVRAWAAAMRDTRRELENIIKEKEDQISTLQRHTPARLSSYTQCASATSELPYCKCSTPSRQPSCCQVEERRSQCSVASENEMPSCSSVPTPPRRLYKKKAPCRDGRCTSSSWVCDASQQLPQRRDAACAPPPQRAPCAERAHCAPHDAAAPCGAHAECTTRAPRTTLARPTPNRTLSPTEELFRRVEQLSDSLADGYRRWTRGQR